MAELLLELLSEEIPARMQARAAEDLQRLVTDGLKVAGLAWSRAEAYVTPRRLALVIDGLPAATPDIEEERRGPRVGAPQAALDGFLKSAGVALEQCEKRDTGKGEFWFAVVKRPGRRTAELLKEIIEATLANFPWPKSMRWSVPSTWVTSSDAQVQWQTNLGQSATWYATLRWVRPLHGIECLFDGAVVPVAFGPVTAGNSTVGHRFLAPQRFAVTSFVGYRERLREAKVILDQGERREKIREQAERVAAQAGLSVKADPGLLDEVTGLVEWPVVLMGHIDEHFMDIPPEVLTTTMRANQKYFALLKPDGALAPRFLVVANIETADGGRAIVAGNERVLRARLSDAKFFWDQDRKARLDSRLPRLAERTFYAGLGTMADKAGRLERFAADIARMIGADADAAGRAGRLAKADLSTEMVGEFPELQGVMGRYYALHDGEAPAVAQAIADHYSPLGPNDGCPTQPASVAVALADKIDSLVGFFGMAEKPTGSKDPFALRRAALGVIRLILENRLRLRLREVFDEGFKRYGGVAWKANEAATILELLDFFADRLKVHLRERGVRHDLIAAVFALGEDDLVRLVARVQALAGFLSGEDGADLLVAYRRAANILRIEEKKDGRRYDAEVNADRLEQHEEKALYAALAASWLGRLEQALHHERFAEAMGELARLRGPVDAFFEKVTVNSDDAALRANRLHLLSGIVRAMNQVADFSLVEG